MPASTNATRKNVQTGELHPLVYQYLYGKQDHACFTTMDLVNGVSSDYFADAKPELRISTPLVTAQAEGLAA